MVRVVVVVGVGVGVGVRVGECLAGLVSGPTGNTLGLLGQSFWGGGRLGGLVGGLRIGRQVTLCGSWWFS